PTEVRIMNRKLTLSIALSLTTLAALLVFNHTAQGCSTLLCLSSESYNALSPRGDGNERLARDLAKHFEQAHSQGALFIPAPNSPVVVGAGPGQVILADVNGDGHLDMVTRHLQSRLVTVQIGDGTVRFAAAPGSPISMGYMPVDLKLGDVNNDKILDLGVTNSDRDEVDIFLGNGKGGFSRAPGSPFTVSPAVDFYTRSLNLEDINEDGNLDIVTAN